MTVSAAVEVSEPTLAVMVAEPAARVVTMPLALTVATLVLLDAQVADPDTLPIVRSAKAPIATKVTAWPMGAELVAGLILMPVRVTLVTVMLAAGEDMPLIEATMVVLPGLMAVTAPVALTAAMALFTDVQVTRLVRLAIVPSV